jgi:hypothetical protein
LFDADDRFVDRLLEADALGGDPMDGPGPGIPRFGNRIRPPRPVWIDISEPQLPERRKRATLASFAGRKFASTAPR